VDRKLPRMDVNEQLQTEGNDLKFVEQRHQASVKVHSLSKVKKQKKRVGRNNGKSTARLKRKIRGNLEGKTDK